MSVPNFTIRGYPGTMGMTVPAWTGKEPVGMAENREICIDEAPVPSSSDSRYIHLISCRGITSRPSLRYAPPRCPFSHSIHCGSGATSSFGTNSGAFRVFPFSTGMRDRSGTVCNCRSMTKFNARPDVDR